MNIPYIFEVRDLWPEAPIQMGLIKSKIIKSVSRMLESHIYKNAEKIIALSPGIKEYVHKMIPGKRVLLCPNMADCGFFNQYNNEIDSLKKEHNIGESFVISYFGAIGWVNALDYYLNLANICMKEGLDIKFFLIGSGAQEARLIRKTEELKLDNLIFVGHVNKQELKKYLSITDAAYISFANYPILEYNSPNKFFDSLASGKLVISNVKGWILDLIEEHNCGLYINPEKSEEFIPRITPFMKDPALLKTYKSNARNLAENRFERKKLVEELLNFIEN
jgi:glycosyltransferase involved in cell wall biosynthesis